MLPTDPGQIPVAEVQLEGIRRSYLNRALETTTAAPGGPDLAFLAAETRWTEERVRQELETARVSAPA
jgi:hypothetical protein